MSFKIISLVQPNFQQGPKEINAHYLPYSVGVLWSYVQQFPKIRDNITLDQLIWNRTDIRINVDLLKKSNIIAFSTYIWNKNYNYELAKQLKEINPACIIIFGGPEVPITKHNIFKNIEIHALYADS